MVIIQKLDNQLKKTLGELQHEPIYDYIAEMIFEDFNNEEYGDFHQQNFLSTLQGDLL